MLLQVLRSWKTRRLLDAEVLEQVTEELENRKTACVYFTLYRNRLLEG